jgi:hypothetical protein
LKDHNYITILGWMVNRLGLSGNELMVYAIIHRFSQDKNQAMKAGRNTYTALAEYPAEPP